MHILIPIEAVGSLLGALIVLIFALYSFIYLQSYQADLRVLNFMAIQICLFLYLVGYSVYSSALTLESTIFWTKICYVGLAASITASFKFYESFFKKDAKFTRNCFYIITGVMIISIFFPGEHFFTKELNILKNYNTVVKGEYFKVLVISILASHIYTTFIFSRDLIKHKELIKVAAPIEVGFTILLLNGLYDGIVAAILSLGSPHLWVGATAMAGSLAVFTAQEAKRRHSEADRYRLENEKIYLNLIKDNLTGLFTRDYFIENLKQTSLLINRYNKECSIVFLDLDNFKLVNDQLGHNIGDKILKIMGKTITTNIRKSDVAARLGGDEFILQLIDCENTCTMKICKNIQTDFKNEARKIFGDWKSQDKISISIGYSTVKQKDNPETIIHKADLAMYNAKRNGKNQISEFSSEMEDKLFHPSVHSQIDD